MQPVFQITGPQNDAYPGYGICLPQVPMPTNLTVNEGDNATIQVVENAKHGAALFSCVDITFTHDMSKVEPVNEDNCQNATYPNGTNVMQFGQVFSTTDLTGAAARIGATSTGMVTAAVLGVAAWVAL